jgi:hypothetical protein
MAGAASLAAEAASGRAVRAVLDTSVLVQGWSIAQAGEYKPVWSEWIIGQQADQVPAPISAATMVNAARCKPRPTRANVSDGPSAAPAPGIAGCP